MSSDPRHGHEQDRELEEFLAGRHPLSRAYREAAQSESAPPELDAGILVAAREAARVAVPRRPRWLQPIALAATLALGVTVLLQLRHEPAVHAPLDFPAGSVPSAEMSESAPVLTAPAPAPAPREARADSEGADTAATAKPIAPSPGDPAQAAKSEALSEALRRERPGIAELSRERSAAAIERNPAAAAAGEPATRQGASPQSLPPPPPVAGPEPAQRRSAASMAPFAAVPEALKESEAVSPQKRLQSGAAGTAPAPEPFPHVDADVAVTESQSEDTTHAAISPQAWFERMRERRRARDDVGATALFKAFRKAYPDVRLPEDLRDLEGVAPQ